jgi:hypothetical protein
MGEEPRPRDPLLPKPRMGYDRKRKSLLWVVARSRGARGRAPSRRRLGLSCIVIYNHNILLRFTSVLPVTKGMRDLKLISKTLYLRAILMLPAMGLLSLAGCANLDGTAGQQTAATTRAGTYWEQQQERPAYSTDQDPDQTSEWFY